MSEGDPVLLNYDPEEVLDPVQQQSDAGYIEKWGPDLTKKWHGDPEMLGKLHTAHMLICQLREIQEEAWRQRALNALRGNVSPDMKGKSLLELMNIHYKAGVF